MQQLSQKEILAVAARKEIFVDKYSERNAKMRKKTRRMHADGLLNLERSDRDGFFYTASEAGKALLIEGVKDGEGN